MGHLSGTASRYYASRHNLHLWLLALPSILTLLLGATQRIIARIRTSLLNPREFFFVVRVVAVNVGHFECARIHVAAHVYVELLDVGVQERPVQAVPAYLAPLVGVEKLASEIVFVAGPAVA